MRLFFAFLMLGSMQAQEIKIIGEAPFFPSTRIELLGMEDWVVAEPKLLAATSTTSTGHFDLTVPAGLSNQVAYRLKIGRDKTALHLEAGKTYRLILPSRNAG